MSSLILALVSLCLADGIVGAPSGFPKSGKGLWYTKPAVLWSREYLPVGNGYLAAMVGGTTSVDQTQLNIESLWSGGPFSSSNYTGGNKDPSTSAANWEALKSYQSGTFAASNGQISNVSALMFNADNYGSYASAGFLTTTRANATVTNYARWLDLETGFARSTWSEGNVSLSRETFCSHPAAACFQKTSSSTGSGLGNITYALSAAPDMPLPTIDCLDTTTIRLTGLAGSPGMEYELLARVQTTPSRKATCKNGLVTVSAAKETFVTWVGGTQYDINAGDAAHDFSFKGVDPHAALLKTLDAATSQSYTSLANAHQQDFTSGLTRGGFNLDLGQKPDLTRSTDQLVASYQVDTGNAYLEWITFHYGRYLLFSSARGVLPANLQGKWAMGAGNPWSADYHSNINIQMNYWFAESTNMDVTKSLFDYFEKTWAPRGTQTAKTLYNASGWVVHNEINVFGHSGMKEGDDEWANYPESNAWMMLHVFDHFDYTNDIAWWKAQGWPLTKNVALFHLDKLIADRHFNDGTLVVNPCNSPEQEPTTFGCAHAQQLIWQLFNGIEKGFNASGDQDTAFLERVRSARTMLDKGIHIGSWGQLQEWKVDLDQPNDTHRHLSHLIGLYPGYAVSNFDSAVQQVNLSNAQVLDAAKTSLIHRGNGTGPDADSGWEKVWRAAAWAQLQDSNTFYHELTYALQRNFGANLFSLYDPANPGAIFQIDANFGFPAAMMNALLQAPDVPSLQTPLTITLLPALPTAWPNGSLNSARVRGGMSLSFSWTNGQLQKATLSVDQTAVPRPVRVVYKGKTVADFTSSPGSSLALTV